MLRLLSFCLALATVLPVRAIDPASAERIFEVPAEGTPGIDEGELYYASLARDEAGAMALVGVQLDSGYLSPGLGAAYLVAHEDGEWREVARLRPQDPHVGMQFGYAVALRGDVAVVSAHRDVSQASAWRGAVYVFRRSGSDWSEEAKLVSPTGEFGTAFGFALALRDDELLVGDPERAPGGAVFRFRHGPSGWDAGALVATGPLPAEGQFGQTIVATPAGFVVGAPYSTVAGANWAGLAYALAEAAGGELAVVQTLQAATPAQSGRFGVRLAQLGSRVAVRSRGYVQLFDASAATLTSEGPAFPVLSDDADNGLELGPGRLYVGVPNEDTGGGIAVYSLASGPVATLERTLTIPEVDDESLPVPEMGKQIVAGADFVLGHAPRYDDGGENTGALFGFVRNGNTFGAARRAWPHDGLDDDLFGYEVAADANWLFVAQPFFDREGVNDEGRVLVYRRSGSGWSLAQVLAPDNDAVGPQGGFGAKIALEGDTALIASFGRGDAPPTVSVFNFAAGTWTRIQTLAGAAPNDGFGAALALHGDDAFVGRISDAVLLYHRTAGTWSLQQTLLAQLPFGIGDAVATDGQLVYSSSYGPISVFARNGAGQFELRYRLGDYGRYLAAAPGLLLAGEGGMVNVYATTPSAGTRLAQFAIPPNFTTPTARVALADDALYYSEPNDGDSGRVYACPRNGTVIGGCTVVLPPEEPARNQDFGSVLAATPGGLVVVAAGARDPSVDAWRPGKVYEYRNETFRDGFE